MVLLSKKSTGKKKNTNHGHPTGNHPSPKKKKNMQLDRDDI